MITNDVAFTVPMAGAAIWTAVTGDTFLPSFAGAVFAVYFRAVRGQHDPQDNPTIFDLFAVAIMSFIIGVIAGPYFASQLPDGDGVIGVGALITAFIGTGILSKLDRMDWDVSAFVQGVARSLGKRNGKTD